VDFIIRSVDDVLRKEFGRGVSDENVHILDPFAGTGTFIVQLLQSGLIRKEDFLRKYKEEIHANEIVLLAYFLDLLLSVINLSVQTVEIVEGLPRVKFEG